MFKNITLSVLCIFAMCSSAKAQFTIDSDTLWTDGYVNAFEFISHTSIRNHSAKPDTIVWNRTVNTLPSNWTSAVCDILQCYGTTVNTAEFILDSMVVKDMSFHFYPASTKGQAKMVVRFARKSNPSVFIDVLIGSRAYGLGVQTLADPSFDIYPNPAINFITIGNAKIQEGTFEMVNVLGEKVMEGTFSPNQKIDVSMLNKGIYFVHVKNENSVASAKLVIE